VSASLPHGPVAQLPLLSHGVGGSDNRFDSLAGVERPDCGCDGSGGGP
jgi:hypothetical protein